MNSTPVFRRLSAILPGLVLVAGLALSIYDFGGLAKMLQNQVFDLYQRIEPRKAGAEGPRTVYVDIGARSAERYGAWPWPRKRLDDLVAAVRDAGAKTILLDMPLSENDPTARAELLKLWGSLDTLPSAYGLQMGLSELPDYDREFAALLRATPTVMSFTPGKTSIGAPRLPEGKDFVASEGSDARHYATTYPIWRAGIAAFEAAASGNGATLPDHTPGSAVRGLPMIVNLGGTLYPSNVLEALRVYRGGTGYRVNVAEPANGFAIGMEPGIDRVEISNADLIALTSPTGCLRLYFGGPETRVEVSAADLLAHTPGLPSLDGKIAVIGVSANGTERFYDTAAGVRLPSGAIAANAIDQILEGAFLVTPGWSPIAEQLFILIGGGLVILIVGRFRFRWSFLFTLVLVGGAGYASWWAFQTHRWMIDPSLGSVTLIVASFTCALMRRLHSEEQTRFIDGQFARRLSSGGLAKMHAHPKLIQAEGNIKPVTSVVVGLRGFNIIADRYLEDPKAYADILNRFFSPMTKIVQDRNGMVDRTVGDTMYAVWNAPFDVSDHASKGCDAALRMVENLEALNEFLETDALRQHLSHVPLSLSIGIDSGLAITGNMGAILRFDYGVLGEPVSFAAHLQRNARNYGPAIIVGEGTQRAIGDRYALLEIDLISTPRHPEGRRVFALLGDPIMRANPKFRALQEAHALIFSAYRNQRWADARRAIAECRKLNGAIPTLYDFYEARISQYETQAPGEHWNGSWFAGRI
ncbi:MAG: adenylate/guanylate cyclase domain-containing protein [Parvibaculum sp.]|uniref:CHASE2 domain-containing protein n=1 Tax=Parvibaculum sp. TaxID=2024848 RepID=UPI0025EA8C8C|nr:adenylate/guanylate cyclase domain-containing protein [Parvibaculum sp.]MCE9650749.1 adenylate/guanylate cyclase domain-containing protein [Parvibaculum sp.]